MMYMGFFLGGLITLSLAVIASIIFGAKLCTCIPAAYSFIGLLIFVFMVFGLGQYGAGAVILLTGISMLILFLKKIKSKEQIRVFKFTNFISDNPGVLFWLCCMVVLAFLYDNYGFMGGDDHAMWLTATKQMFFTDEITCIKTTNVSFAHYIPGKACVEYFYMKLIGTWDEPMMHRIISLWLISFGLPVFEEYKFHKNIVSAADFLVRSMICIISPFLFTNAAYSMALSEPVLIGMGSFLLFVVLKKKEWKGRDCVWIALMIASLTSIKAAGAYIGIFILLIFIAAKRDIKPGFAIRAGALGGSAIALTNMMWLAAQKMRSYQIMSPYESAFSMNKLITILSGEGTETEYLTIKNFIGAFIGKYDVWTVGKMPISNIIFLLMEVLICVYIYKYVKDIKAIRLMIMIVVSTLLYQMGILYTYLFVLSGTGEGVELASYFRYSNIWNGIVIIALLLLAYVNTCGVNNGKRQKKYTIVFWAATAGIIFMSFGYVKYTGSQWVYLKEDARDSYNLYCGILHWKNKLGKEDRVYIVVNDNAGYEYLYNKYLLCPIWTSPDYVRADTGRYTYLTGDDFSKTRYFSPEEWTKELEGYTYVYLSSIDDDFQSRYGGMFDGIPQGKQMYKIEYLDNRMILVEEDGKGKQ